MQSDNVPACQKADTSQLSLTEHSLLRMCVCGSLDWCDDGRFLSPRKFVKAGT